MTSGIIENYSKMEVSLRQRAINYAALLIFMVFYAGTWTYPYFYHITEIYNSSIIFVALGILFLNNVPWIRLLKAKDPLLIILAAALIIALVNLFIISSNKGCFLIIADFLMLFYMIPYVRLTKLQFNILELFFLFMFASWFFYDRAFSYNANTGATVTVFTFFGAMILLQRFSERKEINGFFIVISFVRVVTLVLWHLARGAFIALFLFLLFYYLIPRFDKKRFFKFITYFSTFGSLVFVAFYIFIGSTGFNLKLPFFYKSIFSGREQIWYEVWEMFCLHPLTGIGSGYKLKSFFEYNIHNAMYDILAVHGVIVFALSLIIIIKRLFEIQPKCSKNDRERLCAVSAIFAIFIESFIDMDLMWANYTPLIFFLLMESFKSEEPLLLENSKSAGTQTGGPETSAVQAEVGKDAGTQTEAVSP